MGLEHWVAVGLILFTASILQAIVGFSFSLLAVPLLLIWGFGLVEAVVISVVGSLVQRTTMVCHLRNAVDWRSLIPMMFTGLVALFPGIYLMYRISFLSQSAVRQIIGICILLLLFLQWFSGIKPRDCISRGWGHLAAFFSGLLTGLANIGGPPIILWILAHRWPNDKMRVTILAFSLVFVPFQFIILPIIFGKLVFYASLKALVFAPIVLLGVWLELAIGGKLKKEYLRLMMQLLLLVIAIVSIIKPFLEN